MKTKDIFVRNNFKLKNLRMDVAAIANGLNNFVVKRCLGPFWYRRRWLSKTQWLDATELEELQLKLFQQLITHCYKTVPYYKDLMCERGIKPEDIQSLEDIKRFPVLTRKDILKAGKSLVSTKYPRGIVREATTGGTTGTPLILYRDIFSIGNEHAFVRRQWDWAGVGFSDRCAYLTGRLIAKPDDAKARLFVYDPVMKELILSTYHLSRKSAKNYACVINDYEVKALVGYASAIYFLAQICSEANIEIRLKAVLTSSEILTASMCETIERVFQCKVFDFYGSAERTCDIQTCDKGSYHIIPEYGITELIPTDQPDTGRYRIISTGFWNKAMPLIRYDMNDIVVKSERACPCGRQFPVIKSILGREGDIIKTPSGRTFGAAILTHLLYGTNHIVESQIVQDALDHITIKYVPSEQFSPADMKNFERLAAKHLPSELSVAFEQTDAIEKTKNGKIRPVVSLSYD